MVLQLLLIFYIAKCRLGLGACFMLFVPEAKISSSGPDTLMEATIAILTHAGTSGFSEHLILFLLKLFWFLVHF